MTKQIGITFDSIDNFEEIVAALKCLPFRPLVRIVFDAKEKPKSKDVPPEYYFAAVKAVSEVATIVGELVDSFYVQNYSIDEYVARAKRYFDLLGPYVTYWEVGNEISGSEEDDWLGPDADKKALGAYDYISGKGGLTALTYYWTPRGEWLAWSLKKIPPAVAWKIDLVTMSVYTDDNGGDEPDWEQLFSEMGKAHPMAQLMVGEFGPGSDRLKKVPTKKRMQMCMDYWTRKSALPSYVGAIYWYGSQALADNAKSLIQTMKDAYAAIQSS